MRIQKDVPEYGQASRTRKDNPIDISVIIPAFNEEKTIVDTIVRTEKVLKDLNFNFEIIVIDDYSTDSTRDVIKKIQLNYNNVVLLFNKVNRGKSVSLNRGFEKAKGLIFIMMDADLQQVPEDIPLLIEKIEEGYDVVNGWRKNRNDPLSKLVTSRIYNSIASALFGTKIHDMNCGFKAIRKEVLDLLLLRSGYFRYLVVLAKDKNFRTTEVEIRHFKRGHDKSKYGMKRILDVVDLFSIKMKLVFAKKPMLFFGTISFIMLVTGLSAGVYLTYLKFFLSEPISQHLPMLFFATINIVVGISIISMGFIAELLKDLEYRMQKKKPIE